MSNTEIRYPTLFADTSDISTLKELFATGVFDGITTNPIIVAKEAGDKKPEIIYRKLVEEFPQFPVSIQLIDGDISALIQSGKNYASISANVVIKVPMFGDGRGLAVTRALLDEGIKVNVTGMMKAEQALLASLAGSDSEPTYLSLFMNRIKDSNGDPELEIRRTRAMIEELKFGSKIITGSIRKGSDVYQAVIAGSHIVTVPPKIFWEMTEHYKTEEFIHQCQSQWRDLQNKTS